MPLSHTHIHDICHAGYGWQLGWLFQCLSQIFFSIATPWAFSICLIFLAAALASFSLTLRRLYLLIASSQTRIQPFVYAVYVIPTSMNTAWLSVATCLGGLVLAKATGMSPFHLESLSLCLAVAMCSIGLWVIVSQRDGIYGFTLIWALVAIVEQQHKSQRLHLVGLVCIVVLGMFSIMAFTRERQQVWDSDEDDDMQQSLLVGKREASTIRTSGETQQAAGLQQTTAQV